MAWLVNVLFRTSISVDARGECGGNLPEDTMLKIVTLQKRRAGLSVEDFQNHLREAYGPLAARGPGLARYVQSCALPQGYVKGELLFDAIGEMWRRGLVRHTLPPRNSTPCAPKKAVSSMWHARWSCRSMCMS